MAYQLVHDAARAYAVSAMDMSHIEDKIRETDMEVASDEARFEQFIRDTEIALSKNDSDRLIVALLELRISAINISTIFSNLADQIEKIVVDLPPYTGEE